MEEASVGLSIALFARRIRLASILASLRISSDITEERPVKLKPAALGAESPIFGFSMSTKPGRVIGPTVGEFPYAADRRRKWEVPLILEGKMLE